MAPASSRWIATVLVSAALAAAQTPEGIVTGQVTNVVTGAPILRAHVVLRTLGGQNSPTYGALTDAQGNFSIRQLPAGEYFFTADAPGFQPPPIVPNSRHDSIRLVTGEWHRDLYIELMPWSSISGRVIDADGRPVQGVEVSALGLDGFVGYQTSDPRGEFRIARVSPGRYRVRAAPEAVHIPPEIRSDGTTEIRNASTYYPSALTPQAATPIDLAPGADRTGIEIRLVSAPIVAVRGAVSGIEPGGHVSISANRMEPPRGPNTGRGFGFGNSVESGGAFEIWGLDPGTYLLDGMSNGGGWGSAPVQVTVAGKDVDGIEIRMMREFDIPGRVVFGDGQQHPYRVPPNAPLGERWQISLHEIASNALAYAVVAGDGSFHLTNVRPGRYVVNLSFGAYVQTMEMGAVKADGEILDLRGGSAGATLTVTASSVFGAVRGMVSNAYGPVADAPVACLEEGEPAATPSVIRTHPDGTYSFFNLRPGKYHLVPLGENVVYAFDLRDQLFDYAVTTVEVHAGDHLTRDLRMPDPK